MPNFDFNPEPDYPTHMDPEGDPPPRPHDLDPDEQFQADSEADFARRYGNHIL